MRNPSESVRSCASIVSTNDSWNWDQLTIQPSDRPTDRPIQKPMLVGGFNCREQQFLLRNEWLNNCFIGLLLVSPAPAAPLSTLLFSVARGGIIITAGQRERFVTDSGPFLRCYCVAKGCPRRKCEFPN